MSEQKVTVRKRSGENIGPFTAEEFLTLLRDKIKDKSLEL
jgi:threonyl-tRNA synthetase